MSGAYGMDLSGKIVLHDNHEKRWLEFTSPRRLFRISSLKGVQPALAEINRLVNEEKLYAAGFISYDAAPAFDSVLEVNSKKDFPLLWFGLYDKPTSIDLPETEKNSERPEWKSPLSQKQYNQKIEQIKEYICRGESYQVNYTYRMGCQYEGDPWTFFLNLQAAQKARYGAYVDTGDWAICSASPELFFSLQNDRISTCPMKGTASRGMTLTSDRKQADWLFHSEKNRAENRMIVDMIRNDLGRIAETGSVRVPQMFQLEKFPTLWQMVTPVLARTNRTLPEIFNALFPCASITGAPKCRTMEIIRELEETPRGIYTGSIGYIAPDRIAQFNVAIRTAVIHKETEAAEYGTGGGVTWDSSAGEEFEETITKAKILSEKSVPFSLLETIKWEPESGYYLLDRHLDRLRDSATYFSYPYEREKILNLLTRESGKYRKKARKIRLLLAETGNLICEETDLPDRREWTVNLAKEPVYSGNPFLYHKTTNRDIYNKMKALSPGLDDVLLWNERNEITESCIGNVVACLKGQLVTPPVSCGLLAGTYRAELIQTGRIIEKKIFISDLKDIESLYLINSLRDRQDVLFK